MSSGDRPSPERVVLAYAEGDRRPAYIPGGQDNRPQREQTPEKKRERQRKHRQNRSKANRDALRRYHRDYKRDPKMKRRREEYRENPDKYRRRGPKPYTRPDKSAGDIILYEQDNPTVNEVTQPGDNVSYRAEGPSTYRHSPDEKAGLPKGHGMPAVPENTPPGTSRVIPDEMKETLRDQLTYMKGAAASPPEILGRCGPKIIDRAKKVKVKRKRFDPDNGFWTFTAQGSKGKEYTVRIKGVRKGNTKDLFKTPVLVSCTCNAFRWEGPEHWAKVNGYLYGKPQGTASKPVVRDPDAQHWACKHVVAALNMARQYRLSTEAPQWSCEGPLAPMEAHPARVTLRYLLGGS